MRNRTKVLIIILILIILVAFIKYFNIGHFLTIENFHRNKALLINFVRDNYLLSVLIFIATFFIVAAFSLPGEFALAFAGGYLFSTVPSVIYVDIGATAGAAFSFIAARYLLGNVIQKKYGSRLAGFNKEIAENGRNYMLALRFTFIIPFFLINLLAGLSKIRLRTFVWTTAVGILPSIYLLSYTGSKIYKMKSLAELISFIWLIIFLLFCLAAVTPVIVKKIRKSTATVY
jgi:uncharacterized membrane protein YdjX (TVP38/TMEM64 family)